MYYPELLEIVNLTGAKEAIERLDKYLAFLPMDSNEIITTSKMVTLLSLDYDIVDAILRKMYELGFFKKVYIVVCPECGREIFTAEQENLMEKISNYEECIKCDSEISINTSDIYVGYKLKKHIPIDRRDLIKETEKLFNSTTINDENETLEKLFKEHRENPHDFFYNPSEAQLSELRNLYESLDDEFETTTEQGKPLEGLVVKLFNLCKGMNATPVIRTKTNQIDCTVRNDYIIQLTVYKELGSIFRCECKNEPKKKPGNTYYRKLSDIIKNSKFNDEHSVGILVSRLKPAITCETIARENFLRDNIVIINLCNEDLKDILYNGTNLLDRIQEKIQAIKGNFSTAPDAHKLYRKDSLETTEECI
ncbi:hypothetical protein QTH63_08625 [Clostridium perfringens]|nr:hypothetical protein [Clostridium perfringens]MDU1966844.1 hypothetical protein [Clostridium perfringens]